MSGKSLLLLSTIGCTAFAQSFNSSSTGADGALVLAMPGTVVFDPRTFNPPLNSAGDNVYHFTTIYIAKGVTVKLSSQILGGPVFWLAQGPVQIDGVLDLNGADGGRGPSPAGAGGYPGGVAGRPGYRPTGFTPNVFLVPLVGGFGGDGGEAQAGGSGGGALLIASSALITLNGSIIADGGASTDGIGGDGGSIRLVAPTIDGSTGSLSAKGGPPRGGDGLIRFEAFNNRFAGSLNNTPVAQGKPFGLFLPPGPTPSVRVLSIDGRPFATREFSANRSSSITVVIEAHNIPPGNTIELQVFDQNGVVQTITTTPLIGTLELSRAWASVTFPAGSSHVQVKAEWKLAAQGQQPQ